MAEVEALPIALPEPSHTQTSPAGTSQDLVTTNNATDAVLSTDGADGEQKKMKKIIRKKRRPARPQVDPATMKSEPPPQTGTIFNIW